MDAQRSKAGFTLIELLIVVVIIGILAAIALPKFGNSKSSAQVASMKSDLRNLATAQETRFAQLNEYGSELASLSPTFFQPSTGVNIDLELADGVYTATATIEGVTTTCTLTVGGTNSGIPTCAVPEE